MTGNEAQNLLETLQWKALSGLFYHQRTASLLQTQSRVAQLLNIALSTGAIATFFETSIDPILKIGIPTALAVVNAYTIAFDISNRSYGHLDLAREWRDQLNCVNEALHSASDEEKISQLVLCEIKDAEIDKREPPPNYRLGQWSQLKAARALGLKAPRRPILLRVTSFWW